MRALLRYAILKTSREQVLAGLLFAPAVIFAAPLLGIAGHNAIRGETVFPMALDARLGARGSSAMITEVLLIVCAFIAGIASFRMFRSEVTSKAMGSFFLATPPRTVAVGIAVYGAMVSVGAYLIAAAVLSTLTASPPADFGRNLAIAAVAAAFSSALASLTLAISGDFTMLVPVAAGGIAVGVALRNFAGDAAYGGALVGIVVIVTIARFVWGRRCVV